MASYKDAAWLWWAITWRTMLALIPIIFLIFFMIAPLNSFDIGERGKGALISAIGWIANIGVSIWILQRLLNKGFRGYSLSLNKRTTPDLSTKSE